MQNKVIP